MLHSRTWPRSLRCFLSTLVLVLMCLGVSGQAQAQSIPMVVPNAPTGSQAQAQPQAVKAPAATVEDVQGKVTAKAGSESERPLAKNAEVFVTDVLTTGDADKVRLVFTDNSSIDMGPKSVLKVADFAYDSSNAAKSKQQLGLAKGTFRFVTGKVTAQNPDNLRIESPLAQIGIRGTTTDHNIKMGPNPKGPGEIVEEEVHALRETKKEFISVRSDGKTHLLTKPDQAVWLRPNLPGAVRALSDQEKQDFGKTPFNQSPFDPRGRGGFTGGGG